MLALLVLALGAVVTINTLRLKAAPLADRAPPPPPIDPAALARLSEAIQVQTISTEAAAPSPESLAQFHSLLERNFPRIHAELRRETVSGGSLLYTWPGTDAAAPALLLAAHQDVVPVENAAWTHPPFSGAAVDGVVWGRGALDDKGALMAIMEAVERLLARGVRPKQTVYLAFGHDEERGGTGAQAMASLLKQRGARLGLALDEGFAVLDGVIAGVTSPVALIGVAEKGYLSVELTATGGGGHSSMPANDNPADRIARAVGKITRSPFPARTGGVAGAMLDGIAPYASTPLKVALANRWLSAPLVTRQLLASPETAASIRTTTALTVLQAGSKDNVVPQAARAVINHRILPGDTVDSVLARDRETIGDPGVRLRVLPPAMNPSRPVPTDSAEYQRLSSLIRETYPHAAVAPGLVLGATDGRHYQGIASAVLRFAPFTLAKGDPARIHGTNERVGIADYMRAIAFYERLIAGQAAIRAPRKI